MAALNSAFLVLVKASKASSRELAFFLPKALVLEIKPSNLYKALCSITLVSNLAPTNISILIYVRQLLEEPISGI